MKRVYILALLLIAVLLIAIAASLANRTQSTSNGQANPVYVGVAFGGNNTEQAKLLIDRVKSYTNLFILAIGLNPITANESAVREICDYATSNGLNIITSLGTYTNQSDLQWKMQFYSEAKKRYGDKFLGAYYDDDIGGVFLDWNWYQQFHSNETMQWSSPPIQDVTLKPLYDQIRAEYLAGNQPQNYSIEAQLFEKFRQTNVGFVPLKNAGIHTFTTDYALYWFDYLGGYDTMFVQLGYNNSVNQELALIRGAATMQNKDWGAIITWKYMQPPYLASEQEVYNQMMSAYNAGAKYITIFDFPYNTINPYGSLTNDHFLALKTFWTKIQSQPPTSPHAQAALVLPKDYGWGMRSSSDKIWGYWGPDDKSPQIWNISRQLLNKYGLALDIIYDDPAFPIEANYTRVYYWNQTL